MNDDLHAWLDGDAGADDLDLDTRRDAQVWDRLVASLRSDVPGPAPARIEVGIMAELRGRTRESGRRGVVGWLLRPRTVRLSPLSMGGLAAAALVAALLPRWLTSPRPPAAGDGGAVVYVQFVLRAPEARSVAVSGDFNQWAGDASMEDPDGDGIWTVRIPLEPGLHEYMFVVDGERWVTDPNAERYADDGFGNRNAVLAVALPERSS